MEFRSFFVHKSVQLNAHFVLDLGKSAQKLKMPGNAAKRPILLNIPERDLEMILQLHKSNNGSIFLSELPNLPRIRLVGHSWPAHPQVRGKFTPPNNYVLR